MILLAERKSTYWDITIVGYFMCNRFKVFIAFYKFEKSKCLGTRVLLYPSKSESISLMENSICLHCFVLIKHFLIGHYTITIYILDTWDSAQLLLPQAGINLL
ncbi:hypothetical protein BK142_14995 [Paenibacillus glucanolyticus]|nr:hypothetical protein BK142_14995 [Paenibacillus glucanolyticus]